MSRKYLAPAIAVVVIVGLIISVVKLWRFSPYKVAHDIEGNPEIVLSLSGVEIAGRNHGQRYWSFRADKVDISRGRLRTIAWGVRDGQLFDGGKLVAKITAGEAIYDAFNNNIQAIDGVKVESVRGFSAATDLVLWSSSSQMLICPGKVVFSSGDSKLVGSNLVADARHGDVMLDKGRLEVVVDDIKKLEQGAGKPAPGVKQ